MVKLEKPETWQELISFRQVYREQFDSLLKVAPLIILINVYITLGTAAIYLGTPSAHFASLWAAFSVVVALASYVNVLKIRSEGFSDDNLAAKARQITILSAIRGLIWATALIVLMPESSLETSLLLGWIVIGLICGGVFAYWAFPVAAVSFSGVVALGGGVGIVLSHDGLNYFAPVMVFGLYIFFVRIAFFNARVIREQVRTERELAGKTEVVGLLLKDFEEGTHAWIWEMSQDGKLTRGMSGFEKNLNVEPSQGNWLSCSNIMRNLAVSSAQFYTITAFDDLLTKQEAFADHLVSIGDGEQLKFIELSAKPIFDKRDALVGVALLRM
jgi:hypothetical protein